MAGRGGARVRWGEEERALVFRYLNENKIETSKVESAAYLRSLREKEEIWRKHSQKNFNQNVRRQVATWTAAQDRAGGRRQDGNGGGDEGDGGVDIGDDEDEDEDEAMEEPDDAAPPPIEPPAREL